MAESIIEKRRSGKAKLVVVGSFLLMVLALTIMAGAFIEEKAYFLGDDVKIDLSDYQDYSLRIETPTKKIIKDGSEDVLLFNLDEIGVYEFKLSYGDEILKYSLEVVNNQESNSSIKEPEEDIPKETISIKDWENEEGEEEVFIPNQESLITETEPLGGKFAGDNLAANISVGEKVRWNKRLNISNGTVIIDIPYVSEEVTVNGEAVNAKSSIYSKVVSIVSDSLATKEVVIENSTGEIDLEYFTPAPEKSEKKISDKKKEVVVSAPDYLGYKDVFTTTALEGNVREKNELRVYWKEESKYLDFNVNDLDGDGTIDEIDWIVPHLSTQTFEIIVITQAEHLDKNRNVLADVFLEVSEIDNKGVLVSDGEYLRVVFESPLDNTKDITIYAASKEGASVEIYEKDSNNLIDTFEGVSNYGERKIFLTKFDSVQDTFDLKVVGGDVYFDYVVDPTLRTALCYYNSFSTTNWDTAPGNMVDGNIATYTVDNNDGHLQTLDANNCTDLGGTISKVELRYNGYKDTAARTLRANLQPQFLGGTGSSHDPGDVLTGGAPGAYINWIDVTSDTNAPGVWTWAEVIGMDMDVINNRPANGRLFVSDAQIQVTYLSNDAPTVSILNLDSSLGYNMTTEDLICSPSGVNDLDGDLLNATVRWYKDGSFDSSVSYNNNYVDGNVVSDTLNAANTNVGEAWKCSISFTDGFDSSSWVNSSEITILPYVTPPSVLLDVLWPLSNVNVFQNQFFNVTVNVSCLTGNCGTIDVIMDPISESFENFEVDEGGFTHAVGEVGKVDEWHRSSAESHDGSFSFKSGGAGAANYVINSYGILTTPIYSMTANSTFSFMQHVSTETCYDGGKLEYRLDSGAWTKVTSFISGGYNNQYQFFSGGPVDWVDTENIWCGNVGTAGAFSPVEVDLSAISGSQIEFRFLFGSDDSNTPGPGWYVDAINFTTEVPAAIGKGTIPMNSGTPFYTTTQNPFTTASLNAGQSEVIVYNINATGTLNSEHEFFSYANLTADSSIGSITPRWNVTIKEDIVPVSIVVNYPAGTFADPTPFLNVTLSDRQADTLWYDIDGSGGGVVCNSCIGEVTSLMNIDSEGSFTLNVYANNSNGDLTHEIIPFVIDMNSNFYDSFYDNHSIFNYGDSTWESGSVNYTATETTVLTDGFEVTSVTFLDLIDGTGGSCSWFRDEAGTQSGSTGPSTGHTGSFYAYMETSNGACNNPLDTATMESVDFNITGLNTTLSFWYHMYGSEIGTLEVEIFDGTWNTLWSVSGQQQTSEVDVYTKKEIDLSGYSGTYKIRFKGTALGGFYGDMAIDDVLIIDPISKTEVVSRVMSTNDIIAEFTNVSWNSEIVGSGDVNLQLSTDNGVSWSNATNGEGLVGFTGGTDLIYKILFEGTNSELSLTDLNLSWTNTASPAPDITINSPSIGTFADVTPILNFTTTGATANNIWYTINGGSNQNVCSSCSGNFLETLYLQEGAYTVIVYTDNSVGVQKSDSVSFTVDMNGNYFDTYFDNSQVWSLNGPTWQYGNITYQDLTGGIVLNETFDTSAALDNWTMNGGVWEVVGGELRETSNGIDFVVTYDNLELSAGKNYNISMRYMNGDDDESGIVFRYKDALNYYKCSFVGVSGNPNGNMEGLTKWEAGVATVFNNTVNDGPDVYNDLTVSIVEDNITCYLNGVAVYNVFDSSWDGGKIGVFNRYDTTRSAGTYYTAYDTFLITTWEDSIPALVSYPIKTVLNIVEVLNVSWNYYVEGIDNEVTVDISTDNGINWHSATNGAGLGVLEVDNDLVYRVNYESTDTSLLGLLDMDITWTHSASPAPAITITPVGAVVKDTTPVLTASINGPAEAFWYTVDGGNKNIICTTCSAGTYDSTLLLEEGDYIIRFYANNSVGTESNNFVNFEVNMNRNYFDTYTDSSQISVYDSVVGLNGNLTFTATGKGIFDDFDDGSLGPDWTTSSTGSGRIEVTNFDSYSGLYSVIADSLANNALNELVSAKDFSGATDVQLSFYYREFIGDEDNVGSDHVGTQDADAVYFTCDGNQWYHLYDLLGTTSWQQINIDVSADPDFCTVVNSSFAIKFTQFDNFAREVSDGIGWDNINISIPGGNTQAVSHPMNVSQSIRGISDISWNTAGEDVNNPITLDVSVDSGVNWYAAINGAGLTGFGANNSLTYRVNFDAIDNREMSLLDLNITWEEPPTINIMYPENNYVYNSPITKMNYTVVVSGSETLDSCWYTNNSGVTNYTVSCGSEIATTSVSGVNIWTVYANDSSGAVGSDTVQFILDTAAPGIIFLNQSGNPVDEGSEFSINVNVTDSNTDSVWIVIWDNVVGGASKFTGFLSNLFGDLFSADVLIDSSYNLSHNYTIYANDTTGLMTNYTGSFDILKMMFSLDNNPIYADGILPAYVSGHLGLSSGANLINHPFNIWLEGELIPFENLTAHGTYLSELNFTGQTDMFSGSLLSNVSDAGGYLTLTGSNTTGTMVGALDAGALVDWGAADWTLLSGACSGTVNYYDGVSWGYSGTEDTFIDSGNPNTNYGISNDLNLDTSPTVQRTLLKFENIFGYGLNKIPYDSSVTLATLSTNVYVTGNAPTVYEILEDWSESTATYNGRLPGQTWSSNGVAGSPSRSNTPLGVVSATTAGVKSLTVTDLVKSWNNKSRENFGVVYNPGGSSGVQMRSSEYVTVGERPRLDVTFSSTECAGVEVYYRTSVDKSVWSDWNQVFIGEEIIDDYGASRYLDYKVVFGSYDGVIKPNLWDIKFNYTATVTDSNGDFNYSFATPTTFGTYGLNFTSGYRTLFSYLEAELKVQSGIDPVIKILWPNDNYWSSLDTLTFEYNATDLNGDLASSILYVDGANVSFNQSVMVEGYNEMDYTFTEGCHNWSIAVFDSTNLNDTSPNRTVCIDLVDPTLTLNYPPHQASYTVGLLNLSFTPQDNLDSQLSCNVTLDNVNIYENVDYVNGTIINVSSGLLAGGVHNWNVTCSDEAGRSVSSPTREFTITDTPPTLSLLSPVDGSVSPSSDVNFTFFPTDNSGLAVCELFIDGSFSGNVTNPLTGKNATILATGLADGFHNWSVTCSDLSATEVSAGNWSIGVDTTGPTIEIFNLADNFISVDATPDFDIRITDAIDSLPVCELMVEGGVFDTFNATSGSRFNFTSTNALPDGINSWYLNCSDSSGYHTSSAPRNIDVREAPVVSIDNVNQSHVSSADFSVTFTPSDNSGITSCSLYVDGVLNSTLGVIVEDVQNLIEPTGFLNGIYDYYMSCVDGNGNVGTSSTYEMTLDTVAPVLTPLFPIDEAVYATNITFNFTVEDTYSSNLNCSINVDGTIVNSNIIASNSTNVSRVVSGIADGVHDWNFTCVDQAGNSATSATYNFSRLTAPGVNLVTPLNNSWINVSDFAFTYFPQDDEGFDRAELYLNGGLDSTDNSVTSGINNWFNVSLVDGVYDWYVKVVDNSLIPQDSEVRRVYVDTTSPVLNLGLPTQDNVYSKNGVDFNFTVSDNLDTNISCELYLGGSLEWFGDVASGNEEIVRLLVVDGNHTYNINCSDNSGNQVVSSDVNFTVIAPPVIELVSPVNETRTQNSSINFSYKPLDDLGFIECSMYLDSVQGETSFSVVPNVVNNFTVNGITEGVHDWSVECTDTDTNVVMSEKFVFTRDITVPTITLHSPEDLAKIDSNIVSAPFTWEPNDNLDSAIQCDLTIDSVDVKTNVWVGNGTNQTESISGLSIGSHEWNVTCWDRAGNTDTSITRTFDYQTPDFVISEMTTNGSSFTEGESVFVNATLENIGAADSSNVVVDFYLGHPSTGSKFGSYTLDIAAGEKKYLNGTLSVDIGLNELYVVVDYLDSFTELSEVNNIGNVNVSVGAWQYFYGDITGESNYTLSSQQGDVLSWSADAFNDGSIFMSDKDSLISWNDLNAFGRDTSGSYNIGDYADIDFALDMTGFSDSVSNLYLSGGIPYKEDSFSIFGNNVLNVPVANSTDNANFETGILWDMDDDSDFEFDSIEREDLVFVTKINKDAVGKYGVYDYELRVPAKLREYSGAGSEAVFYVELF